MSDADRHLETLKGPRGWAARNYRPHHAFARDMCLSGRAVPQPIGTLGGAMKILITEDEPILAEELETIVRDLGHQVVGVASTLGGALRLAEQSACDLALVDVYLRDGTTGPDLARHLVKNRHAAVIFTTSSPNRLPEDLASACGVLAKPLSEQSVKSAIRFVNECLVDGHATHPKPRALHLSPAYAELWKVT